METEAEFYTCRDLGCDFAQGYLIAWPALGWRAVPIGGDDFFAAVSGVGKAEALAKVAELVAQFRSDAESLYDPATREAGWFLAKDRYGATRVPLLLASGVAVVVAPGPHRLTPDAINAAIAEHKALAKGSKDKVFVVRL